MPGQYSRHAVAMDPVSTFVTRLSVTRRDSGLGSGTYVLRHPSSHGIVVVDPVSDPLLVAAVRGLGRVELVAHTGAVDDELARMWADVTGAPVRGAAPGEGRRPFRDGEIVVAAGVEMLVLSASEAGDGPLSFLLLRDRPLDGSFGVGTLIAGDPDAALDLRARSFGSPLLLPVFSAPAEEMVA